MIGSRFSLFRLFALAAFIAAVAVGLLLLAPEWYLIVATMTLALLIAWTIEWLAWREAESRWTAPDRPAAPPAPVGHVRRVPRDGALEARPVTPPAAPRRPQPATPRERSEPIAAPPEQPAADGSGAGTAGETAISRPGAAASWSTWIRSAVSRRGGEPPPDAAEAVGERELEPPPFGGPVRGDDGDPEVREDAVEEAAPGPPPEPPAPVEREPEPLPEEPERDATPPETEEAEPPPAPESPAEPEPAAEAAAVAEAESPAGEEEASPEPEPEADDADRPAATGEREAPATPAPLPTYRPEEPPPSRRVASSPAERPSRPPVRSVPPPAPARPRPRQGSPAARPASGAPVVSLPERQGEAREWNVWELDALAREAAREAPERADEWSYVLLHLREFADPGGTLPAEFDPVVRESFGGLLERVGRR